MKIGIISSYFYPWYGGITEHVYHQYRELKKRGHEVRLITPFDGMNMLEVPSDLIKIGKPVTLLLNGSIVKVPIIANKKIVVDQIIENEKFDIIHLHQPLFCLIGLAFLKNIRNRKKVGMIVPKVVGTFHACGGGTERFLIQRLGFYFKKFRNDFDFRIAVSHASRDFVLPVLPGEYAILPNGVDIDRFCNVDKCIERFDDGTCNILFVGRLEPRKGLTSLLQSLSYIKDLTNKKFRLIIVGNGVLTKYYKSKVPKQVEGLVHFVGDVSFEDIPRYYKTAQIFCSPATYGESFGIVLIEAMAAGLPVVAGDNEGYRKVIRDNENGILVDPQNPKQIAKTISQLIESSDERVRLSKQSTIDCLQYSWTTIISQIDQLYTSLCKQPVDKSVISL